MSIRECTCWGRATLIRTHGRDANEASLWLGPFAPALSHQGSRLIIDDTFPQTRRFRGQCHNVQSRETAPKPLAATRVTKPLAA